MMGTENGHIILIGFMGAGKTSVGKTLAKRTGMPLVDTDQMIEAKAGMPVSEIFSTQGEDAFRKIESQVLQMLKEDTEAKIISTGGGLPLREENRKTLRTLGKVVLLQVKAETVLERLAGDTTRPLLQGENKRQKVEELLTYRSPVYRAAAEMVVNVDDRTVEEIVQEILAKTGVERI